MKGYFVLVSMGEDVSELESLNEHLQHHFPSLPEGKIWIKGDIRRIYYNPEPRGEESLYVSITDHGIYIGNVTAYWKDRLGISSFADIKDVADGFLKT